MTTHLAVVGAHLSGQPLNHQLTERGATLVRTTATAPDYRLHALSGTVPPKPALERLPGSGYGYSIEVEIWEITHEALGSLLAATPPPLGLGTIRLEDNTNVTGYICEPYALQNAKDISTHGSWRAYLAATA